MSKSEERLIIVQLKIKPDLSQSNANGQMAVSTFDMILDGF